jgi:hypothetical protein
VNSRGSEEPKPVHTNHRSNLAILFTNKRNSNSACSSIRISLSFRHDVVYIFPRLGRSWCFRTLGREKSSRPAASLPCGAERVAPLVAVTSTYIDFHKQEAERTGREDLEWNKYNLAFPCTFSAPSTRPSSCLRRPFNPPCLPQSRTNRSPTALSASQINKHGGRPEWAKRPRE